MQNDPGPPHTPPHTPAWSFWLGGLASAAMLGAIAWQLARTPPEALAMLERLPPAVAFSFAGLYLAQPLADLAIYHRVWGLPLSALGALLRKTAINEAVLGYGGEVWLYFWAGRRHGLTSPPFAAIKDVNIVSSMLGLLFTLAAVVAAALWSGSDALVRVLRPALWPAAGAVSVALLALAFARRVFSLKARDIAWVAGVHALRLTAACGLTIACWALASPGQPLKTWVAMLAVTLVGQRVPFLTNKSLLVSNVVLLLLGPGQPFAVVLAALAVATLAAHLAVIAALSLWDLRRPEPSR